MDQMLPSPGFSIPSIGTPFQQLEEDQTIIANNPYYAQNAMTGLTPIHPSASSGTPVHPPTGLTPAGMGNASTSNNGVGSSGLNTNIETSTATSLPSLINTPTKGSSYQPSYTTPQSMMQPQTPVSCTNSIVSIRMKIYSTNQCSLNFLPIAKSNVSNGANDRACTK